MNVARYVRIFNLQPSDELVEKRSAAIEGLCKAYLAEEAPRGALQLAADLVRGVQEGKLPETLSKHSAGIIAVHSPSFSIEDGELDALVCSLAAALKCLAEMQSDDAGFDAHDAFACALSSGLEFQQPLAEARLEALRQDVLEAARGHVEQRAEVLRERIEVESFADAEHEESEGEALSDALRSAVDALRWNAELDREEIDLLWWVLADWSSLLRTHFSRRGDLTGFVAGGLEMARKLRHLPAESHYQITLRFVPADSNCSLSGLIDATAVEMGVLRPGLEQLEGLVPNHPSVFPLLSSLISGQATRTGDDTVRPYSTWVRRVLAEAVLARQVLASQAAS
jgi:hypothetical protein